VVSCVDLRILNERSNCVPCSQSLDTMDLTSRCKTQVMGASFRNVSQVVRLAGCDLLTIGPELLDQLEQAEGALDRKLDPTKAQANNEERIHLDEKTLPLDAQRGCNGDGKARRRYLQI
jgi:transaldolase